MAKVCIDGHRFDTNKAKHHWELCRFDGHNHHTGDLYVSSKGQWYVETPDQWPTRRRWELTTPNAVLSAYQIYLTEAEITEIAELAKLEWE
jgi:hypothetical protein